MPHICTRCNSIFESGEDILKGCPACGWKKFMFTRARPDGGDEPGEEQIITRAMGVRMPRGRGRGTKEKDQALKGEIKETNHTAPSQGQGRSDRLPPSRPASGPDARKDDVRKDDARKDNVQKDNARKDEDGKLESIKITSPGTYELNLPSLFEREELIMAVKEGTYFIDLSSAFRKGKRE